MSMPSRLLRLLTPWQWPIAVKVPAIVAAMMVLVSVVISNIVHSRLRDTQEKHLAELTGAYLDGLSSALQPHVLRKDVWEVFDVLDRSAALYGGLDVGWTTVAGDDGRVIASSQPHRFTSERPLPDDIATRFGPGRPLAIDTATNKAYIHRELVYQGQEIGSIFAEIDVSKLIATRSEVLLALVLTNGILTAILAAFGYLTVRRMLQPVRVLSGYIERSRRGPIEPIPAQLLGRQSSEFGRLFRRYNALVEVVAERELVDARLAEEERLASLGRLASGMAHEINNPLGGMLNALDSLKRHGERPSVRETSIRLIEQGLTGIRDLVRSTLMTYRSDQRGLDLTGADIDDLRLLVRSELKRKRLACDWHNAVEGPLSVPAGPARDAILNLLVNACHAAQDGGRVGLAAMNTDRLLVVTIDDDGPGMAPDLVAYLAEPTAGRAPVESRGGLGLWMVKRFVEEWGGSLDAEVLPSAGTRLTLRLRLAGEEVRHAA